MNYLTVPGESEFLQVVLAFVQKAAENAGLGKQSVYRLRLAVDEIATNIVLHGYKGANLCGNLTVRFEVEPQQIVVHLEDTGSPFDPSRVFHAQQQRLSLHKRPLDSGLGIYIALSNVDDYCYKTDGVRNHSTFIMHKS